MRDLRLRLILADGRPPGRLVHIQLRQEILKENLFIPFQCAFEEHLPISLIIVAQIVEDVCDVADGQVPSVLAGKDMQDLENVLGLQQNLPDLSVHRDDIYDGFPVFLGGSPDDIVGVDELRVVALVDALVDRFEVIVEHFLVAIFMEIVEELVEFRQEQLVVVLLDEGEELLFVVLLLLELEDGVDVFDEGQLSAVQFFL